jgi:hypothetical protein
MKPILRTSRIKFSTNLEVKLSTCRTGKNSKFENAIEDAYESFFYELELVGNLATIYNNLTQINTKDQQE